MHVFNADGGESDVRQRHRCVANSSRPRLFASRPLTIGTGRGVLTLELEVESGSVRRVRVDMGRPIPSRLASQRRCPATRRSRQS